MRHYLDKARIPQPAAATGSSRGVRRTTRSSSFTSRRKWKPSGLPVGEAPGGLPRSRHRGVVGQIGTTLIPAARGPRSRGARRRVGCRCGQSRAEEIRAGRILRGRGRRFVSRLSAAFPHAASRRSTAPRLAPSFTRANAVPSRAAEGLVNGCGWHGMQGVRGSNPLSSTRHNASHTSALRALAWVGDLALALSPGDDQAAGGPLLH